MSKYWVLVGAFGPWISTLEFTTEPPSLSFVNQTKSGTAPTWLTNSPSAQTTIFATDEQEKGSIVSLTLDINTGSLTNVSNVPTQGGGPTHLALLKNGTEIGAANFDTGSAFFIGLGASGQFDSSSGYNVPFTGSGPGLLQESPRAHQIVEFNDEVFVPDYGSDKIWRLAQEGSQWAIKGSIDHVPGTGPRHIVVTDGSVYTLNELANTVTEHTISPLSNNTDAPQVANVTVLPPDVPKNVTMAAAELLYACEPTPLLYASNRNVNFTDKTDPKAIGDGDAITVLVTDPELKVVKHVKTGLAQIRAMAFIGKDNKFILAAGQVGGGVKVFERVSEKEGYLKEVAHLNDDKIKNPTSFVSVKRPTKKEGEPKPKETTTAKPTTTTKQAKPTAATSSSSSSSSSAPTSTPTPTSTSAPTQTPAKHAARAHKRLRRERVPLSFL